MYVSAPADPSPPSTSNFIPELPRKAKLEALGLAVDAPADKAHVGGHAVVDGKKYVIEPKEEM